MGKTGLAIKAYTNVISGGYPNEEYGADRQYEQWTDVPLSGSAVSTYYYRDSDYSLNHKSTRVLVTILDEWSAVLEPDNSFTIRVNSSLLSIVRDDRRGYAGPAPRSIMVRQHPTGNWLRQWPRTVTNNVYTIFAGNIHIGEKVWHLYPEGTPNKQSESSTGSIYYRSVVTGHENTTPPSIFVDEFFMGINYKNTLPRKLHPPKVYQINQRENICPYRVDADFLISMDDIPASDNNLHTVMLQVSANDMFTSPMSFDAVARRSDSGMTYFSVNGVSLIPNRKYYYRVQLKQPDQYLTDWAYGSFTAIPVIKPKDTVPEFSANDCAKLTKNQKIGEWPNW